MLIFYEVVINLLMPSYMTSLIKFIHFLFDHISLLKDSFYLFLLSIITLIYLIHYMDKLKFYKEPFRRSPSLHQTWLLLSIFILKFKY